MKHLSLSSTQELDTLVNYLSEDILDETSLLTHSDVQNLCNDIDFNSPIPSPENITDQSQTLSTTDIQKLCADIDFNSPISSPESTEYETVVDPVWNDVTLGDDLNVSELIDRNRSNITLDDVEVNLSDLIDSPNLIEEWMQKSGTSTAEHDEYLKEFINSDIAESLFEVIF